MIYNLKPTIDGLNRFVLSLLIVFFVFAFDSYDDDDDVSVRIEVKQNTTVKSQCVFKLKGFLSFCSRLTELKFAFVYAFLMVFCSFLLFFSYVYIEANVLVSWCFIFQCNVIWYHFSKDCNSEQTTLAKCYLSP